MTILNFLLIIISISQINCSNSTAPNTDASEATEKMEAPLLVGAAQMELYLPKWEGKKIGLVVNATSMIDQIHLVDTLRKRGIAIEKILAPEHGFRGTADAGEIIKDGVDAATGIPVISIYGSKKKPSKEDLAGLDLLVFDIQDVGARFYTYTSTLTYVMEACAENQVLLWILDRPNPLGHYTDGPILDTPAYRSFVGMHPMPVVHGLTVGEFAQMLNGEGWLNGGLKCPLEIVPCAGYDHQTFYELPVKPSPNLPNIRAIYLYPSICFFEGTDVSVGRGTDKQFQVIGTPGSTIGDYTFTPEPKPGAMQPPQQGKECRGFDLSHIPLDSLRADKAMRLAYLIDFFKAAPNPEGFFSRYKHFDLLAGSEGLRKDLLAGKSEAAIRAGWAPGLEAYRAKRKKYLLYPE